MTLKRGDLDIYQGHNSEKAAVCRYGLPSDTVSLNTEFMMLHVVAVNCRESG